MDTSSQCLCSLNSELSCDALSRRHQPGLYHTLEFKEASYNLIELHRISEPIHRNNEYIKPYLARQLSSKEENDHLSFMREKLLKEETAKQKN